MPASIPATMRVDEGWVRGSGHTVFVYINDIHVKEKLPAAAVPGTASVLSWRCSELSGLHDYHLIRLWSLPRVLWSVPYVLTWNTAGSRSCSGALHVGQELGSCFTRLHGTAPACANHHAAGDVACRCKVPSTYSDIHMRSRHTQAMDRSEWNADVPLSPCSHLTYV